MSKSILDVGNCDADHSAIARLIRTHFEVDIVRAHGLPDALESLRAENFDLVLVNRLMDRDGSPGLSIIESILSDEQLKSVPVMMLTNYEEHQQTAIAAGAKPGFGKMELATSEPLEKLRAYLA